MPRRVTSTRHSATVGWLSLAASGNNVSFASAMAIRSDGKIVAVGNGATGNTWDFAVVRYNKDGTLDSSFGGIGIVLTSIGRSQDEARAVAITPGAVSTTHLINH